MGDIINNSYKWMAGSNVFPIKLAFDYISTDTG